MASDWNFGVHFVPGPATCTGTIVNGFCGLPSKRGTRALSFVSRNREGHSGDPLESMSRETCSKPSSKRLGIYTMICSKAAAENSESEVTEEDDIMLLAAAREISLISQGDKRVEGEERDPNDDSMTR
jgi:TATA-binding protein-associated factor Taf7